MERITSKSNQLMVQIRKLVSDRKHRRRDGLMVCEGPKMLAEALRWGADLDTVVWEEGAAETASVPATVRQVEVPKDLFRSLAATETPQRVLFLCRMPVSRLPDTLAGDRYLVLDGLQDPGNVGTLWRTADAFGADGMILLPGSADPWNPKTLRATMGACFRLPVWESDLPGLEALLEREGLPLFATALREDTEDIRSLSLARAAVVIGSEGKGVSEAVLSRCEKTIKIPMEARCESLNAAVAGAVVLWQMGYGRVQ
ncbi:MAG: RNA methyltransferase [Evtepia sp.]|uniref:TrmH family RNA methyltransferase n=1 Tax=Evtepia sp. TaxID=2773933 RepID=UPI002A75C865|nr:RNA methyltransferase [Evtepia sp.]MDY3014962.1 RNA methyltransferase [Evtepia sp.]